MVLPGEAIAGVKQITLQLGKSLIHTFVCDILVRSVHAARGQLYRGLPVVARSMLR
jgi:hypothetical protein